MLDNYYVVEVVFAPGGKKYSYLSPFRIEAGTEVNVPTVHSYENEVTVVSCRPADERDIKWRRLRQVSHVIERGYRHTSYSEINQEEKESDMEVENNAIVSEKLNELLVINLDGKHALEAAIILKDRQRALNSAAIELKHIKDMTISSQKLSEAYKKLAEDLENLGTELLAAFDNGELEVIKEITIKRKKLVEAVVSKEARL